MTRTRARAKGRRDSGSFIAVPKIILEGDEYASLTAKAVKLLLDVFGQYNGRNNGDLACTWLVMRQRGWRSRDTLGRALKELLENRWIVRTRQGGRFCCSLYAVTWKPIDECGGKLDVSTTRVASMAWREIGPADLVTRLPCQPNTATVSGSKK